MTEIEGSKTWVTKPSITTNVEKRIATFVWLLLDTFFLSTELGPFFVFPKSPLPKKATYVPHSIRISSKGWTTIKARRKGTKRKVKTNLSIVKVGWRWWLAGPWKRFNYVTDKKNAVVVGGCSGQPFCRCTSTVLYAVCARCERTIRLSAWQMSVDQPCLSVMRAEIVFFVVDLHSSDHHNGQTTA